MSNICSFIYTKKYLRTYSNKVLILTVNKRLACSFWWIFRLTGLFSFFKKTEDRNVSKYNPYNFEMALRLWEFVRTNYLYVYFYICCTWHETECASGTCPPCWRRRESTKTLTCAFLRKTGQLQRLWAPHRTSPGWIRSNRPLQPSQPPRRRRLVKVQAPTHGSPQRSPDQIFSKLYFLGSRGHGFMAWLVPRHWRRRGKLQQCSWTSEFENGTSSSSVPYSL